MYRRFFIVLAALAAGLPAWAQTAFEPIAAAVRAQALSLPAETPVVILNPGQKDFPRSVYTIRREFASDGTFTVRWAYGPYTSSQKFRPDGTLQSGKISDASKKLTLEAVTDQARTTVRTVVTEAAQTKSDKKAALKPGIALRDELQHLILQAWHYGIRDGLKFQSLSPDGGMVGDFQILFTPTADPLTLSSKYTYPEEFKMALKARNNYLVADMSLQGVGAFFYPHHFYLVYVPSASGLEWVGYFGEDPKNAVFQYLSK